jgi:flagellar protein FlaG
MDISPLNRINPLAATDLPAKPGNLVEIPRTVVAAVRALNKSQLFGDQKQMLFARDQDTQKMVIRIVERNTGEVIDQIPTEQMLRILEDLRQQEKDGEKP